MLLEFCVHPNVGLHPTLLVEFQRPVYLLEFHAKLEVKLTTNFCKQRRSFSCLAASRQVWFRSVLAPALPPAFLIIRHLFSLDFFFLGLVDVHSGLCAAPLDTPDPRRESILALLFPFWQGFSFSVGVTVFHAKFSLGVGLLMAQP